MNKYESIVEYIVSEAKNSNIKLGGKIPSIREISSMFKCSKSTAVRAYNELEKDHIIYSIPQSGYYLVENKKCNECDYEKNIINFSSGAPHNNALPYKDFEHCINQAIDIYKDKLFSYTDPQGLNTLIDSLIKLFQDYQIFTEANRIFITSGSQQAINILSRIIFPNSKENVLVEQPVYNGILKALELNNVKTIGIRRGIQGIDFDELERNFKYENIKFFYTISRFQNPTGVSYSSFEKKKLVQLANKYDVYIVEDDYLADMETNSRVDPIFSYDNQSRVIYLKSFSKVLLPGVRLGAVILPDKLIDIFREHKRWDDFHTSVLSQGALDIYIKSGMFAKHKRKISRYYAEKMNQLKEAAEKLNCEDVYWNIPSSGFFAGITILNAASSSKIVKELSKKNIILTDTKRFYIGEFYDDKFLRISLSRAHKKDIEKGVTEIIKEVEKYRHRVK